MTCNYHQESDWEVTEGRRLYDYVVRYIVFSRDFTVTSKGNESISWCQNLKPPTINKMTIIGKNLDIENIIYHCQNFELTQ